MDFLLCRDPHDPTRPGHYNPRVKRFAEHERGFGRKKNKGHVQKRETPLPLFGGAAGEAKPL